MSNSVTVRYCHGFNVSGTGQHEVLEYVMQPSSAYQGNCRCIHPQHHATYAHTPVEEGPYVILYTDQAWAAEAVAAILNADGTISNVPTTEMSAAQSYFKKRFANFPPWYSR